MPCYCLLLPVTACYCLFAALFCLENIEFRKWEIICRRDPPLTKIISDIWAGATFFFFALLHPFFCFSHYCAIFFIFRISAPLFSFSRHCTNFFLFRVTAPLFSFSRHCATFFFFALLRHFFSFSRYCATFLLCSMALWRQ